MAPPRTSRRPRYVVIVSTALLTLLVLVMVEKLVHYYRFTLHEISNDTNVSDGKVPVSAQAKNALKVRDMSSKTASIAARGENTNTNINMNSANTKTKHKSIDTDILPAKSSVKQPKIRTAPIVHAKTANLTSNIDADKARSLDRARVYASLTSSSKSCPASTHAAYTADATAEELSAYASCTSMMNTYRVEIGRSWGGLPNALK